MLARHQLTPASPPRATGHAPPARSFATWRTFTRFLCVLPWAQPGAHERPGRTRGQAPECASVRASRILQRARSNRTDGHLLPPAPANTRRPQHAGRVDRPQATCRLIRHHDPRECRHKGKCPQSTTRMAKDLGIPACGPNPRETLGACCGQLGAGTLSVGMWSIVGTASWGAI
jgi:hypothetical protein